MVFTKKEKINRISLRINDKCNFRCTYCFDRHRDQTNNEMTERTADDILKYCKKNNISSVDIPQKEPTASLDILEYIIENFNENGIRVQGITTNGYNMPLELIRLLKKYNMFVLVSYDGIWQDKYRVLADGSSTTDVVEKNILALKGAGVKFNIACVITHEEVNRIYENYLYLKQITGGIAFNFDVTSPFKIQKEDIPVIKHEFTKIASLDLNVFPLGKIYHRLQSGARYKNRMCGAGRGSYCIDYDGTILPCYQGAGWRKIGITLGDIYSGLDWKEKQKFYHYDTATPEKCQNCSTALCGICYVNSYDVMGNMCMPIPINCEIFKTLTEIVKNIKIDNKKAVISPSCLVRRIKRQPPQPIFIGGSSETFLKRKNHKIKKEVI